MEYHKRLLKDKLMQVSQHFPVVVLTGARQVGKTTLLSHLFSETIDANLERRFYVFDPVTDLYNARQNPELFLNHVKLPVLLDEIQYAPELLSVIKRKVDQDKTPGQYWLTGSQNFSVSKNVSESLAGRAAVLNLLPMSLGEIQGHPSQWIVNFLKGPKSFISKSHARFSENKNMTLFSVLFRGGYPGLLDLENDMLHTALASYLRTYIERDVRLLGDISDLQEFSRFVQLVANLTTQEINYSQLGRDIGVTSQTAHRWLNLLVNSYQWYEIPAFSGNAIKRLSGKKKGYFIDTGMICHLMRITFSDSLAGHPKLGAIFETFIVQEILKQTLTMPVAPNFYHWRSYSGAEVDLILELDNQYFPIEIKCKTTITKNDIRGIKAFREAYPKLKIAPGIVIAPVSEIIPITQDCYAVPYDLIS